MKSDPMANMSIFERFQVEDARIRRETEEIEKEMKKKRGEVEVEVTRIKRKREQAAAELEKLTAEYEAVEAKAEANERIRVEAKAVKKEDVKAGRASLQDYHDRGQSEAAVAAEARKAADEKLADVMQVVRTKALEVLRLEVDEAAAEQNLNYLYMYGPHNMLERMKAQVKSLEMVLSANLSAGMPVWTNLDTKRQALARGMGGKSVTNERWREVGLTAVKRLRLDPGIPEDELPTLLKIIAEMEERPGERIDLQYIYHEKPRLSIAIWRGPEEKKVTP
jgi:hypothetical protein